MGLKTCYIACTPEAYKELKKDEDIDRGGIIGLVDRDALYDQLNELPEGCDYVDGEEDDNIEVDGSEWLFSDRECLRVVELDDAWEIRWPSKEAKMNWFAKYLKAYRKELEDQLKNATMDKFAEYELLDPPWKINSVYNRCFAGRVALLNEYGRIDELDYPMELLRLMDPPGTDKPTAIREFIVMKKGIPYK